MLYVLQYIYCLDDEKKANPRLFEAVTNTNYQHALPYLISGQHSCGNARGPHASCGIQKEIYIGEAKEEVRVFSPRHDTCFQKQVELCECVFQELSSSFGE